MINGNKVSATFKFKKVKPDSTNKQPETDDLNTLSSNQYRIVKKRLRNKPIMGSKMDRNAASTLENSIESAGSPATISNALDSKYFKRSILPQSIAKTDARKSAAVMSSRSSASLGSDKKIPSLN